jgi:cell division cycle 2-like protein
MDFLEHDLKTLQEDMQEPFLPSEIKTLLLQLVSATDYLHSNWILHRDLKTSNLLMNNRGQLKVADFGMARYFGDPAPKMTQLVVTLWYRAPELLLGAETYGPAVDMWSIGCIFGELLSKGPLLQGKNEVDQLSKARLPLLTIPPLIPTPLTDKSASDLRAMRHPHRRHLAGLQAPPQRPLPSSPPHPTDRRRRHPRKVPLPHRCWQRAAYLPLGSEPSTAAYRSRGAGTCVLQGGPEAEIDGHVSDLPVEGGARETETDRQSQCAEEG